MFFIRLALSLLIAGAGTSVTLFVTNTVPKEMDLGDLGLLCAYMLVIYIICTTGILWIWMPITKVKR